MPDLFVEIPSNGLPDFSVQPPCSLFLCGCFFEDFFNHKDTEDTKIAQRRYSARTFGRGPFKPLSPKLATKISSDLLTQITTNFRYLR